MFDGSTDMPTGIEAPLSKAELEAAMRSTSAYALVKVREALTLAKQKLYRAEIGITESGPEPSFDPFGGALEHQAPLEKLAKRARGTSHDTERDEVEKYLSGSPALRRACESGLVRVWYRGGVTVVELTKAAA